jgi:hypothetical protein
MASDLLRKGILRWCWPRIREHSNRPHVPFRHARGEAGRIRGGARHDVHRASGPPAWVRVKPLRCPPLKQGGCERNPPKQAAITKPPLPQESSALGQRRMSTCLQLCGHGARANAHASAAPDRPRAGCSCLHLFSIWLAKGVKNEFYAAGESQLVEYVKDVVSNGMLT